MTVLYMFPYSPSPLTPPFSNSPLPSPPTFSFLSLPPSLPSPTSSPTDSPLACSLPLAPVIWVQFYMIIIYVVVVLAIIILMIALIVRFCCLGFCYVKDKKVVVDSTFYTSEDRHTVHVLGPLTHTVHM